MVEPATGVSGALEALRRSRPETDTSNAASLSSASSELSSAARNLNMSQGQIASNTMAVNQMAIASQQQTAQLSMLVNQLNMSVSQLVGAINALSGGVRMSSTPMPAMMPTAMGAGAMISGVGASQALSTITNVGAAAGAAALNAGRGFAGGIGAIGGGLAAPFMPGNFGFAQPGQLSGSIGNAGMSRSMMMGMGLVDMPMGMQQRTNAAEVQRLATERGAFKMGEIMLGAGAGMLGFGANQLGGSLGGRIGGSMGTRMIGGAFGGMAGNLLGGVVGGGLIGSALMAPVNQTMDQIGFIRGAGEMVGRNAFRFAGTGPDRMSFRERSRFGQEMLGEGVSDLMFSNRDMQEIFAGGVENDLLRGVSSSQQTRQRMRQLKESVKVIGQTLGTTIQESMSIMGDLQAVGVGPAQSARFAAGLNVTGLTRQEAFAGQMSFMNRFAGTGMQGSGLMSLAAQSQQIGQTAMRMGMLSPEQIAAAGGRSGVNQAFGSGMVNLMQGALGQLNMAARMGSGTFGGVSGNPFAALSQAGGAASTSNLIGFAANRGQNMRDMLNDPLAQARLLQQVGGIADQFKGMGSRDDIIKLILKQQGVDDPSVFLSLLKAQPAGLREQMLQQQRALAELQVAQATENFSITGRIGRAAQSVTLPVAGGISSYVAGVQDTATNMITDMRNEILGTQPVPLSSGDITVENLRKLRPSMSSERQNVLNARPSDKQLSRARAMARTAAARISDIGLGSKVRELREETDPEKRRELAKELLGKLSGGDAYRSRDPALQKAYEQAISEQFGIDISGALNGAPGGLSKEDRARMESAAGDVRKMLGGEAGTGLFAGGGAFAGSLLLGPGIGTIVGGIAGALGASGRGVSREQAIRLAQSDTVRAYLAEAQNGASENLTLARERMLEELGDDTLSNLVIDAAVDPARAKELASRLGDFGRLGGQEGMSIAMRRGGDILAASLRDAGGVAGRLGSAGSIAAALSGGTQEGVQSAMRQLRSMDREKRVELLAKAGSAGDLLSRTMQIKENMTLDQLMAIGVDEKLARNVLGTGRALTKEGAEELQALMVAQAGTSEGAGIAGARAGFTADQVAQQAKMQEQVMRTAEILRALEESLRSQGLLVPTRGKAL